MSRFSEKRLAQDLAKIVAEQAPQRRKRDGRVIVATLALGLIGNFVFSRIEVAAFLWLITLFALADLICTLRPLSAVKGAGRLALVILIVSIGAAISSPWIYRQYCIQHAALVDGELVANESFSNVKADEHMVEVAGVSFVGNDSRRDPFELVGDKLIIEKDKSDRVLVSAVVRDRQGNLIAEIKQNKWHVYPAASDKNYSSDALEVLDARGRVVLQVQLLTNGIRIDGEFYSEQGGSVRLGGSSVNDPGFHRNDAITPWFQYRSRDHWGEWAHNK